MAGNRKKVPRGPRKQGIKFQAIIMRKRITTFLDKSISSRSRGKVEKKARASRGKERTTKKGKESTSNQTSSASLIYSRGKGDEKLK